MRLIRVTTNYPIYLQQFYTKHPDLRLKSYNLQYQELMFDSFGWADFWTHALSKLGYEVWEPVANAEAMQKAWANENNVQYKEKTWLTDIIKWQVIFFKPDVLFVDDYVTFSKDFLIDLRVSCPSIKLVIGWCGAPYNDSSVFFAYDIVLSNIPELVLKFKNSGHQAQYFKHAFDPRILHKINDKGINDSAKILCSFVGSIVAGKSAHNQREILIQNLINELNIQVFCDTDRRSNGNFVPTSIKSFIYDIVHLLSKNKSIKQILLGIPKVRNYVENPNRPSLPAQLNPIITDQANPPVFGLEMFQTLHDSQITLNNHIDISRSSASNMRLFEATGVGTCLVTDWKQNLQELFEPDVEVVTYRSSEECVEKINWLLNNPAERDKIAKAGQDRTLRDHTFEKRAVQLDAIIQTALKNL